MSSVASVVWPSYLTRQVKTKDTIGVQKGLELGTRWLAGIERHIPQQRNRPHGVEVVKSGLGRLRGMRRYRPRGQLRPSGHLASPGRDGLSRVGQHILGEVGRLMIRKGHQRQPDRERVGPGPGKQVHRCLIVPHR